MSECDCVCVCLCALNSYVNKNMPRIHLHAQLFALCAQNVAISFRPRVEQSSQSAKAVSSAHTDDKNANQHCYASMKSKIIPFNVCAKILFLGKWLLSHCFTFRSILLYSINCQFCLKYFTAYFFFPKFVYIHSCIYFGNAKFLFSERKKWPRIQCWTKKKKTTNVNWHFSSQNEFVTQIIWKNHLFTSAETERQIAYKIPSNHIAKLFGSWGILVENAAEKKVAKTQLTSITYGSVCRCCRSDPIQCNLLSAASPAHFSYAFFCFISFTHDL